MAALSNRDTSKLNVGKKDTNRASRASMYANRTCVTFEPQQWRKNICAHCFRTEEEHSPAFRAKIAIEEQLGANSVSNDDPAEVFELLELVGTGSYGSVFLARDVDSQELCAIKFLELDDSQGNEIKTIVNEINIMKQSIECPYVVEYRGVYMKEETIMVVMEYASCSVEDVITYTPEFKFTEIQIAAVCAAIMKGLAYLHALNITHRDIKSGNVLLKDTGEVRLADFGISHKLGGDRDKMKTLAGSPYWCAPELITQDSYDNRVDVWACGIVAIEMAEGQPPLWDVEPLQVIFRIPKEPPPRLKNPERWSADFMDFLDKCLKKDPKERATARELLSHPFILAGCSHQLLEPVVKQCLPTLLPRKKKDLEEEAGEDSTFATKGTVLAMDKSTKQVNVVWSEKSGSNTTQYNATAPAAGPSSPGSAPKQKGGRNWFGVSLEETMKSCEQRGTPHLTETIIAHFSVTDKLQAENIFKASANNQKLQELRQAFQDGGPVGLDKYGAHELAQLLLAYFRELPEPLLTFELYASFLRAQQIPNPEERVNKLHTLVDILPRYSQRALQHLLEFLALAASKSPKNKMNAAALGQAWGPCFLFPKNPLSAEAAKSDPPIIASLTETLIANHRKLFS